MRTALLIISIIVGMALLGAYMQMGLWLTVDGPIWWMHGLAQWMCWLATPIVITVVLYERRA
jgi:hypothetical protein